MEKEFMPYAEALELKELGFDEPCFGWYEHNGNFYYCYQEGIVPPSPSKKLIKGSCTTPLYQQAFRWFREKYEIHSFIDCKWKNLGWEFQLVDLSKMETISSIDRYNYKTYEEAELECLKKLIEIVKEKQL
jgi:hypothetical protein